MQPHKQYIKSLIIGFALILLCSCNNSQSQNNDVGFGANDTLSVSYATGFDVFYYDNYKKVVIYNPWQKGEVLATYYLVTDDSIQTPNKVQNIVVPLRKIAVTSCTHFEFLNLIGELSTIVGICDPELVYNSDIRSRYEQGKIVNIGNAFNTNAERLLTTAPDAVMTTTYNQQDENLKCLQTVGIPVIFNNEWTERTVLARAEWLKLVAAFYGKEEIACQLFAQIDSNYQSAKQLVTSSIEKPTVMCGGNFKGTWYVPSGESYMAQLFADAGLNYFYENEQGTGSLPLNFESVLQHFSDADVWLNAPAHSLEELFAMDERHKLFRAATNGEVYGFYARTTATGANDFWESGVAHPDLVLKDLIWATHRNLIESYEPTYIIKLN